MTGSIRRRTGAGRSALLAVAALVALALPAAAAQTIAEVAGYTGPDRLQKLIEGARKEGNLTVYSSAPVEDMNALFEAFEKKYGVKVKLWRGSSENLLQRAVVEARANRREADIYETNGPEMEALHREKLMQEIKSPVLDDLMPQAILPHREWIGTRLNVFAAGYNTGQIRKEDLPKTYRDLADPKWKGKLGIEAEDVDWFATVATALGEDKAVALFRDIVKANGISVRKGHTLLTNLVASGEVPMGLTVYNYKIDQLRRGGAPVDWFFLAPVVARVNGVGVSRTAPHPHAAALFFDFELSEGQKILAERDFWPTNRKVREVPADIELVFANSALMLDQNAKWAKLYKEIFTNQSR